MRSPLLSKMMAIGAVLLLLGLLLMRIDSLVDERRWRQREALDSVQRSLAGEQTLLGPLLHRRCTEEWDEVHGSGEERRTEIRRDERVLLSVPQTLKATGNLRAEARYRGLFKVQGYAGATELQAQWASLAELQPVPSRPHSRLQCGPVVIMLSVTDVRGLRAVQVGADGEPLPVQAGTGLDDTRFPRGLQAPLSPARAAQPDRPLAVRITLDLVGTARLALVPAADDTSWSLSSDWPHPSFSGRFLPAEREVSDDGFSARWQVSSLASSAAEEVRQRGEVCSRGQILSYAAGEEAADEPESGPSTKGHTCLDTLSVSFIDPVNPYSLADRATKYALLFIGLTFTSVALVEVLARRRVHPIQYTLVGLALAVFYLLLLSLSEHLRFGLAYALASVACVLLLAYYAAHMLGQRRAGLAFGGGVALLYGMLWVLLRMEQTALVIGTLMLFAALTVVMVLTRGVDWYELVESWRPAASRPSARVDGADAA